MVVFPRAKINLGLRITARRDDGYHDIETFFLPLPFTDALEFVVNDRKGQKDKLVITGIDPGGNPGDNLVLKAAEKLRRIHSFPSLKIHLHKAIPAGAGLGGGSADAAYMLRGLNRLFALNISCEELRSIALELGSDCPFFIEARASYATGRGEKMTLTSKEILKNYYMVLLNPGINVSTKEAYQNCKPSKPEESLLQIIETLPPEKWKSKVVNDFEDNVFSKYPLIGKIRQDLYEAGAVFSLMSGSGSSVYGIFKSRHAIPDKLKKHLIWQGSLQ